MNRGQESDFEEFVRGAGSRLLRTAYLLTGDRGHAEDLVQTALERLARRWGRLDGPPEAYARVVLANLATDRWRRRRMRVRELSVDPPVRSAADIAEPVVVRQVLIGALLQLTPRQRAVLVLRFFADLSEAETAQALNIQPGTVKSTVSRATTRLRALLAEFPHTLVP